MKVEEIFAVGIILSLLILHFVTELNGIFSKFRPGFHAGCVWNPQSAPDRQLNCLKRNSPCQLIDSKAHAGCEVILLSALS